MKISPIYFYSVFTELLGDSWIGAGFYCLGLGFGFVMLLVAFMATDSFFVGILVLGLLEILGSEELRLSFLSLSDLLSFFLDCDLFNCAGGALLLTLSRLLFGTFFLLGLVLILGLDRAGLRLLLRLRSTF